MKTLDRESLARSKAYIVANCSPLARELFAHSFEGENQAGVVKALSAYQNSDGGFGHNLEGDFMLPDSSPMATSVAFQILSGIQPGINARPQARLWEEMVGKGITYLLGSYQPAR